MRKQCVKCINDSTVKNISFNDEQICNYCQSYETIKDRLQDYQNLEANFLSRIKAHQGKHRYDVALGISGGKDSTYVLAMLVKVYKLKVITYTLDNAFLSNEAKANIDNIVKKLNVEHEYIKCDQALLMKTYKYMTKRYLSPCLACSYLGYSAMINYASKVDAGVGIHGRSPWQMLRYYDTKIPDTFKAFVDSGLAPYQQNTLANLYESSLDIIAKYVDKKLALEVKEHLLVDTKTNGYRDFIAYFLYHPYNKKTIITYLKENFDWHYNKKDEHFDCLISDAATYIKNTIAKRPHIMPELSVMVRANAISRKEALSMLSKAYVKYPKEQMETFCRTVKINKTALLFKAKLYGKRWW